MPSLSPTRAARPHRRDHEALAAKQTHRGPRPIRIDTDRAYVERAGKELTLSALEYRLLLLFATNPGKLVTRDKIRDALWDSAGTYIEANTLSVYIKRLRDKIEDDPSHPRLIQTVRGMGYKAEG